MGVIGLSKWNSHIYFILILYKDKDACSQQNHWRYAILRYVFQSEEQQIVWSNTQLKPEAVLKPSSQPHPLLGEGAAEKSWPTSLKIIFSRKNFKSNVFIYNKF